MTHDPSEPPATNDNRRETGGRVLKARPDLANPDSMHDGDRGDATRHHDGTAVIPDEKPAR